MSVLVKGMEKPEHCGYCRFRYDGICHALQKTQYSMNECPLVVIDDAGLNDTISRQAAIDAIRASTSKYTGFMEMGMYTDDDAVEAINGVPSAQPEQLTDKEQRIFLAAMGREEKVCKEVDEECRDCREAYEDSLVKTCHEIIRKVKCALWTI